MYVDAGHIIMYDRKQSAGQSKSRHGPGPARGPYVARPCTTAFTFVHTCPVILKSCNFVNA